MFFHFTPPELEDIIRKIHSFCSKFGSKLVQVSVKTDLPSRVLLSVEAVSDAADADQKPGLAGIFLQLISEVVDMSVDDPIREDGVAAPGLVQQFVDCQNLAAVF